MHPHRIQNPHFMPEWEAREGSAHMVRRMSSTSGVSGSTTMSSLVPVSVWKQCSVKRSANRVSMPVHAGAGASCPAIACRECLRPRDYAHVNTGVGHMSRASGYAHNILQEILQASVFVPWLVGGREKGRSLSPSYDF